MFKNRRPLQPPEVVALVGSDHCLMLLRLGFGSHTVHKVPTSFSTLFGVTNASLHEKSDIFGENP